VGQFYEDFRAVEDEDVVEILRAFAPADGTTEWRTALRSKSTQ
jgi:predicted phosphoribosyltransferase